MERKRERKTARKDAVLYRRREKETTNGKRSIDREGEKVDKRRESILGVGRENIQSVMRLSHRFTSGSHRERYFVSSCLLSFLAPSFFISPLAAPCLPPPSLRPSPLRNSSSSSPSSLCATISRPVPTLSRSLCLPLSRRRRLRRPYPVSARRCDYRTYYDRFLPIHPVHQSRPDDRPFT